MNEVLAIGLHSMQADMARLEQVGMNLANAMTTGYQRGVTVQAAVSGSFATHLSRASHALAGARASELPPTQVVRDVRAGTLKATGQSLDLALAGPGYFEVITQNGPAYTRQGNFRVDERGRLATPHGHAVMGTGGEIMLSLVNPVIATNGAISTTGTIDEPTPLAQLKVVRFDHDTPLEPMGDGLLSAGAGMRLVAEDEVQIHQGFLENSNVSATFEMTSLIQAMRHFESMHKVVQSHDEMLGTAIRKLGEIS